MTAHNLTYEFKIMQSGNKFGLASAFSIPNGLMRDIKKINSDLRKSLLKTFSELASKISQSTTALKTWTTNSIKAMPSNFMIGLNALKMGF